MAPNNNIMDDAVDDRLKQRRISRRELSCLLLNCRVCCGNSRERLDDNQEQPPCDDDVHEMAAAAAGETQQQQQQQQQQDMCCPLHPNVRGRNGRCPLCAAQSARELKRRNSSESVCRDDDGDNNSILSGGKSLHKISLGRRSKSVPRNKSSQQQQQQQLSSSASLLQLRQMIEKAQQSVGRFTPDDDYDAYIAAVYAGEEDFAYPTHTTTATATATNNRYEEAAEAGATDDEEEEASSEEESISSMARNNEGTKNFAESKGFIFPVVVKEDKKKKKKSSSPFKHPQQKLGERKISSMDNSFGANDSNSKNGLLERQYYQDLPSTTWSSTWSGSEEEPICLFPGKKKSTSDVSRSSSHSDSSVTLSSLLSKGSFGSSSESVKSTLIHHHHHRSNKEKMEHHATDSPTSVLEDVASTDATNLSDSSLCSAPSLQTANNNNNKECHDEETMIPFGPPFNNNSSSVDDDEEDTTASSDPDYSNTTNSKQHEVVVPSSRVLQPPPIRHSVVMVEDVSSDTDDEESTTTPAVSHNSPPSPSKHCQASSSSSKPTAASRPSMRQRSFKSALINNTRTSRSKSRSKSRSRARSTSCARSKSREPKGRGAVDDCNVIDLADDPSDDDYDYCLQDVSTEGKEEEEVVAEAVEGVQVQPTITNNVNINPAPGENLSDLLIPPRTKKQEAPKAEPEYLRLCPKYDFPPPPPGVRGPLFHPNYQLGDLARESDMIIFPSRKKSRKGRRRRRKNDSDDDEDSDYEDSHRKSSQDEAFIEKAIGQLRHLDAAFVRRSDGSWTYAIMADRTDDSIRFVVSSKGSTKSYPKKLWRSSVRRVRVLTQRQGDAFVVKDGPAASIGGAGRRGGVARSRSNGRGRLISPSPKKRHGGVLNVPPTITENPRQHHR